MASQLTVLGPGARRHVAKVTPGTHLSDVLNEACSKFRLDPSHYGLQHRSRAVDLSRTVRLSGLSSGARLELTQVSRSPAVVSVALQLPDGSRMLDKFPSSTSLWLILRKFEAGAAGAAAGTNTGNTAAAGAGKPPQKNFTARGVPRTTGGGSSATSGRLYHEAPTLQIMGRDYTSFTDLQKTLGQIGFNNGSVLLKLGFAASDDPLEEAMERISNYFKAVEESPPSAEGAHSSTAASSKLPTDAPSNELQKAVQEAEAALSPEPTTPPREQTAESIATEKDASLPQPLASSSNPDAPSLSNMPVPEPMDTSSDVQIHQAPTSPDGTTAARPTLVYAPPSASTPQAARQDYNPQDYVPSVDHARAHQANLNRAGQNRRLLTDAELEAERTATVQRLEDTREVSIKVRFPDQSSTVAPFRGADTAEDLYAHVRSLLASETEPFSLQFAGAKGQTTLTNGRKRLIADLGWTGRVMVSVIWAPGASAAARQQPSLKKEIAQKQQQYKVPVVKEPDGNEVVGGSGSSKATASGDGKERKKDGVPKWLKFGKK